MEPAYTIGIDARGLFSHQPRGHVKAFINTYSKLAALEPAWHFLLYSYPPVTLEQRMPKLRNMSAVFLDPKGGGVLGYRRLWENAWLPASLLRRKVDVFHATCGPMPAFSVCPTIVTIHDLIPLHGPDDAAKRAGYQWARSVVTRAARVLTPSQYTADDVVATFGEQVRDKLRVVRWAPTDECRAEPSSASCRHVREKYLLPDRYLLAFGNEGRPHKNIPRLLQAYALASEQQVGGVPPLYLTGISGALAKAELQALAEDLNIASRVFFLGYVLESEIAPLLRMATCLLFVSLDEGFGLPPLDAFSCNCPVIAADAASIPEVVGDAALLVDPLDERQIADSLLRLLNDSTLANRLVVSGQTRVKRFTWEKTARATSSVLKEVLAPS